MKININQQPDLIRETCFCCGQTIGETMDPGRKRCQKCLVAGCNYEFEDAIIDDATNEILFASTAFDEILTWLTEHKSQALKMRLELRPTDNLIPCCSKRGQL